MRQGGLTWAPSTNSPDPHGQVIEPSRYQLGPKAPFALLHWTLIGSLHIPTGPVWPRGSAAIVPRRQQVFRQSILRARGGGAKIVLDGFLAHLVPAGACLVGFKGKAGVEGPTPGGYPGAFSNLEKGRKPGGRGGPPGYPGRFKGKTSGKERDRMGL